MSGLTETSGMMYQPTLWGAGLKTLAMLCIVVGILILVLFLIKRFLYLKDGSGHGQLIRVLSTYHMTPKERIALIDVAGEKIVIGMTAESINCLAKIEKSDVLERIEKNKALEADSGPFTKFLALSLRNRSQPLKGGPDR
ncbi:MAG: flagellar biosynthetic protein FliO [Desulfobacterales bacterium]|nr:flagellar biosynthetic protein FliO [Desulfobacterales bacterium]